MNRQSTGASAGVRKFRRWSLRVTVAIIVAVLLTILLVMILAATGCRDLHQGRIETTREVTNA